MPNMKTPQIYDCVEDAINALTSDNNMYGFYAKRTDGSAYLVVRDDMAIKIRIHAGHALPAYNGWRALQAIRTYRLDYSMEDYMSQFNVDCDARMIHSTMLLFARILLTGYRNTTTFFPDKGYTRWINRKDSVTHKHVFDSLLSNMKYHVDRLRMMQLTPEYNASYLNRDNILDYVCTMSMNDVRVMLTHVIDNAQMYRITTKEGTNLAILRQNLQSNHGDVEDL
jgi:hypothetical protein